MQLNWEVGEGTVRGGLGSRGFKLVKGELGNIWRVVKIWIVGVLVALTLAIDEQVGNEQALIVVFFYAQYHFESGFWPRNGAWGLMGRLMRGCYHDFMKQDRGKGSMGDLVCDSIYL
jgi:hypothetical protein